MELIRDAAAFSAACEDGRTEVHPLGLVPTMGAFHDGHRSIIHRASIERDTAIVYLFVNPLQFGEGEDFDHYPRNESGDARIAEAEGADILFVPSMEDMYPLGYPPPESATIDPGPAGDRLEGASRPGHFRGVLTVMARLFELTGPCRAYFGEKDAQQLFLIGEMAADRFPGIEIVACPTIRAHDGVALSSRNSYLSKDQRHAAACLYAALRAAARLHLGGEKDANRLRAEMARTIGAEPLAEIDYVAVVDDETFDEVATLDRPARALVAARVGSTRLIDNLRLG